jgi:hypothetical protein
MPVRAALRCSALLGGSTTGDPEHERRKHCLLLEENLVDSIAACSLCAASAMMALLIKTHPILYQREHTLLRYGRYCNFMVHSVA